MTTAAAAGQSEYADSGDGDLVVSTLLGDTGAYDELARRYRNALFLIARHALGRADLAEDVAQETLVAAYRALAQLQEPSKFAGWLCAIARNRAVRVGQRERRTEAIESPEMESLLDTANGAPPDPVEQPEAAYHLKQRLLWLRAALDRLPPDYRIALQLFYFEDWPLARIADFLSLPITTIKWRLHHGRELLRRELVDDTDPTHSQTKEEKKNYGGKRSRGRARERGAAPAPAAARDRQSGPACQSDRQPAERRARRAAPV